MLTNNVGGKKLIKKHPGGKSSLKVTLPKQKQSEDLSVHNFRYADFKESSSECQRKDPVHSHA